MTALALGRKGDYAIRAMLELSRRYGEGRCKAREIADAMSIPPRYLPQILALLVRRGLLQAVSGREGGYELTRPPDGISVLEVLEAAQGPVQATGCPLYRQPGGGACPLHAPWARAQSTLAQELRALTFADLVAAHTGPTRG